MKFLIGALTALFIAGPAMAGGLSAEDETRVKELALEAILENPEIIREAIVILQQRERDRQQADARARLSALRDQLERDPNAPVLGNPDGDVTIVEFSDYNCPYCKRAADDVKALIGDDGGVRLVYREWPILGDGSVFAAKAALAARQQGKYEQMHEALMSARRVDERTTLKIAAQLGLDIDRLKADMDGPDVAEHINRSTNLARALGFNGTPSFIIGDNVAPGVIPLDQMRDFVDQTRSAGKDG